MVYCCVIFSVCCQWISGEGFMWSLAMWRFVSHIQVHLQSVGCLKQNAFFCFLSCWCLMSTQKQSTLNTVFGFSLSILAFWGHSRSELPGWDIRDEILRQKTSVSLCIVCHMVHVLKTHLRTISWIKYCLFWSLQQIKYIKKWRHFITLTH